MSKRGPKSVMDYILRITRVEHEMRSIVEDLMLATNTMLKRVGEKDAKDIKETLEKIEIHSKSLGAFFKV